MCDISECIFVETGYWIDKTKKQFRRHLYTVIDLVDYFRSTRNNTGVFRTAYSYNSTDIDSSFLYGDFYLDFDSTDYSLVREDAIRAISFLKIVFELDIEKEVKIFFSGNKGLHIIVSAKALGVKPDKNLNQIYKYIAREIKKYLKHNTIDMRIYDNKRLFRIENSKHESTGLFKVYITEEMLRDMSENEIKSYASQTHHSPCFNCGLNRKAYKSYETYESTWEEELKKIENKKNTKKHILKYTPPCIKDILENGAPNGKRNNTIAILAGFFNASGKDLKETVDIIYKWNSTKNSNPVSEVEAYNTIRSIYSSEVCFGCTTIKDLDLCVDEKCEFKKN